MFVSNDWRSRATASIFLSSVTSRAVHTAPAVLPSRAKTGSTVTSNGRFNRFGVISRVTLLDSTSAFSTMQNSSSALVRSMSQQCRPDSSCGLSCSKSAPARLTRFSWPLRSNMKMPSDIASNVDSHSFLARATISNSSACAIPVANCDATDSTSSTSSSAQRRLAEL